MSRWSSATYAWRASAALGTSIPLSYPFSRGDTVTGKLLGRTLITAPELRVLFAVTSPLVVALFDVPDVATFIG